MRLFFHPHPYAIRAANPDVWLRILLIIAAWINPQPQDVIEYLRSENRVLRKKLGKKRIMFNEDQRRRLAVKGKMLGMGDARADSHYGDSGYGSALPPGMSGTKVGLQRASQEDRPYLRIG